MLGLTQITAPEVIQDLSTLPAKRFITTFYCCLAKAEPKYKMYSVHPSIYLEPISRIHVLKFDHTFHHGDISDLHLKLLQPSLKIMVMIEC